MEFSEKFYIQLSEFSKSVNELNKYLSIDFSSFDNDMYESGITLKLRICFNNLFRSTKQFLREKGILRFNTPKDVLKEFFRTGYADENIYENLLLILKDREPIELMDTDDYNKPALSNSKLHLENMKQVLTILEKESSK